MGRLDFSRGTRLYLDTAPIIYAIEEHEAYWVELRPIWTALAAELRAYHALKTPDAIHAATAISAGCQYLIANDNGFRRLTSLEVIILDDLI